MSEHSPADRTISAVFAEQSQIDGVVRKIIDRGIPKEDISVMGRNFQSETRITGFIFQARCDFWADSAVVRFLVPYLDRS